jgi:hypothetical protein
MKKLDDPKSKTRVAGTLKKTTSFVPYGPKPTKSVAPKGVTGSTPKLKTSARLIKNTTTVTKSGDTTRTKYPAQYGNKTKSQLTKVEVKYPYKKK